MELARNAARGVLALWIAVWLAGCVTVAEHRKLEREVVDLKRGESEVGTRQRLADLAAQVQMLEQENRELAGRLEVAEHQVEEALREARAARAEAAALGSGAAGGAAAPAPNRTEGEGDEGAAADEQSVSEEVQAYRGAYQAWRTDDVPACIDRFRNFLQTYPSSAYADDAAYWMADCYFKQGDYKTAVLRFDDVVTRYPTGNKAADALYRQGEALLRLGPGYGNAAGKAFERVIDEYPDSARATEARRQLDLLGSG